jgi:hypothetical protein
VKVEFDALQDTIHILTLVSGLFRVVQETSVIAKTILVDNTNNILIILYTTRKNVAGTAYSLAKAK